MRIIGQYDEPISLPGRLAAALQELIPGEGVTYRGSHYVLLRISRAAIYVKKELL